MTTLLKTFREEERKRFAKLYGDEETWQKLSAIVGKQGMDSPLTFLDQAIQRTVEKTVEEIKYWIYYMGDTSDYPSWGGAVGLTTGLIPKEKVLEVLTYLKSLPENKKDEVDKLLAHPTEEDKV